MIFSETGSTFDVKGMNEGGMDSHKLTTNLVQQSTAFGMKKKTALKKSEILSVNILTIAI